MRPNRPSWPAKWRASNRCSASKGKDAGPFDRAGLQSLEREVGVFELEALDVGPDGDGRRLPQEGQGVLRRVGPHPPGPALPEQFGALANAGLYISPAPSIDYANALFGGRGVPRVTAPTKQEALDPLAGGGANP